MPRVTAVTESCGVVVEIGGIPIRLRCADRDFVRQIEERYAGFLSSSNDVSFDFEIELATKGTESGDDRSEEHTSELQSLAYLVCRLLLEKKKKIVMTNERVLDSGPYPAQEYVI